MKNNFDNLLKVLFGKGERVERRDILEDEFQWIQSWQDWSEEGEL